MRMSTGEKVVGSWIWVRVDSGNNLLFLTATEGRGFVVDGRPHVVVARMFVWVLRGRMDAGRCADGWLRSLDLLANQTEATYPYRVRLSFLCPKDSRSNPGQLPLVPSFLPLVSTPKKVDEMR